MDGDRDSGNQFEFAKQQRNWLPLILLSGLMGLIVIVCFNLLIYAILVQNQADISQFLFSDKNKIQSLIETNEINEADGASIASINKIAFIGNDNNLWVVSPSGDNLQAVTADAEDELGYRFPTWSPSSNHIAFLGPRSDRLALYISATGNFEPTLLFRSPIASPFYLYWSPNGEDLTFLTQDQSGLSMRLVNIFDEDKSRILGRGSPFYWSWAPESDRLLMHVGGAKSASDQAHLSMLDNHKDAERIELNLPPGQFQAPVWSSDGRYAFYVEEEVGRSEAIVRLDMRDLTRQKIVDLAGIGRTFIVVSPDNQHLAYLETDINRPVPLGTPYIVDVEGNNSRQITLRSAMSMYWSPDGKKLALLTAGVGDEEPSIRLPEKEAPISRPPGLSAPLPQNVAFHWWSYQVDDGAFNKLYEVTPTADFMQTVPYFDQYHLSIRFWSPDSRYLVVTSQISVDDQDGEVIVLDMAAIEPPISIGAGRIAVWSWQ